MPPSDLEVRKEFLSQNPNCDVIRLGVGEGDGSAAYYRIHYKCEDKVPHEAEWQYLYIDNQWKLKHKSIVR